MVKSLLITAILFLFVYLAFTLALLWPILMPISAILLIFCMVWAAVYGVLNDQMD